MPLLSPSFTITPRSLAKPFDAACARLDSAQFASALWSRRPDAWTADPAVRQLVANRLGWLTVLDFVTPLVPRLRAFGQREMGGAAAGRAEADVRVRVLLVRPAITRSRARDAHLHRMKIGPARAPLAAERAIALVDMVRALGELEVDPAAMAVEFEHPGAIE